MAVTIAARVSGTTDKFEKTFFLSVIDPVNNEREYFNFQNRNNPGVTPKEILPTSTGIELKDSFEKILSERVVQIYDQMRNQFLQSDPGTTKLNDVRDEWATLTESQRQQVKTQIETFAATPE